MRRQLASMAAAVAGTVLATASAAHAAPAVRAPIRTFVDNTSIRFSGIDWYSRDYYDYRIVRTPRLAECGVHGFASSAHPGESIAGHGDVCVVNGTYYSGLFGHHNWTSTKLSAADQKEDGESADPYYTLAMFLKIPGVAVASPGHYQVTCAVGQISAFLNWDYGVTKSALAKYGIASVTASFWLNSSGRPVKDTITGQSSHTRLSAVETFTKYNDPLIVKAP